jgi:3-oxoacyl-[acyl-carrier protein] reductase
MDLGVEGRTYLVMAASRGLGRAVADVLGQEGAEVFVTSRGPGFDAVLDTGDAQSRQAFVEAVAGRQFDGIFVNTGGPRAGGVLDLADHDWELAFQQLLMGPISLLRQLLPQVSQGGAVLFNASSSIREPIAHLALSNVMRAGVHALAKTLVEELAPRDIRVNLIVPGRMDTERVRELDERAAQREGTSVQRVRERSIQKIPAGRYGNPVEFGRLAAFLLSPAASYLNGSCYWVDGGQSRSL